MAGLYIHIPFCRKVCYYCDFHFTVSLKYKIELLRSLHKELVLRKKEWGGKPFSTIYIGGGTPTVLDADELQELFRTIELHYQVEPDAEISLEANPDDLCDTYLADLKEKTPVNRLSIGIQSFIDRDLEFMNRRHTGDEAYDSVVRAKTHGFTNISADLIYGIPGLLQQDWMSNMEKMLALDIPHISAYHLTIEPKTVFAHMQKKGKLQQVAEKQSVNHFKLLIETLTAAGYEHYEISNFASKQRYSKHNTSYWQGEAYLGIGPSAHSFADGIRRWNVSNNLKYIAGVDQESNNYFSSERLSVADKYNELIMTSLRTMWGVESKLIARQYPPEFLELFEQQVSRFKESKDLIEQNGMVKLSDQGKLKSDYIMSEFFMVD